MSLGEWEESIAQEGVASGPHDIGRGICGPFRPGHDRRKKAKYFMLGVFAIPVRKVEGMVAAFGLG